MVRLSRGCYDKFRRCPGWAGGGLTYASVKRCNDGRLCINYASRWSGWAFHRCDSCDVLVLPSVSRWLDPTWLISEARFYWRYRSEIPRHCRYLVLRWWNARHAKR